MSEENTETRTGAEAGERAGFCQDCGRPLTRETKRAVGNATFCEPCLARRVGAAVPPAGQPVGSVPPPQNPGGQTWNPVHGGIPGPALYTPPSSLPPHLPNPTLAGILGVIPGVGAMYNAQLVKGLLHLAIFAVLVTLDNNVSGVFGLFVAAWEIYMIFDAYHTARARREGRPLPDPLGLNELAGRLDFKTWTPQTPPAPGAPFAPSNPAPAANPAAEPGQPAAPWSAPGSGWTSTPPAPGGPVYDPRYSGYGVPPANWAGYVHPSTFAASSPPAPGYVTSQAPRAMGDPAATQPMRDAGPGSPYTGTYTGAEGSVPVTPVAPGRRFPMGALWLIAAGVLVMAGNLSSEWRLSGLWVMAVLFAALAIWTLVRRLEWAGGYETVRDGEWHRLACMLRAPLLLLTLSVLFVLQAAHVATFGQTWPILLVAFGLALLLERTFGGSGAASLPPLQPASGAGYYPPPAAAPPAPTVSEAQHSSAAGGQS